MASVCYLTRSPFVRIRTCRSVRLFPKGNATMWRTLSIPLFELLQNGAHYTLRMCHFEEFVESVLQIGTRHLWTDRSSMPVLTNESALTNLYGPRYNSRITSVQKQEASMWSVVPRLLHTGVVWNANLDFQFMAYCWIYESSLQWSYWIVTNSIRDLAWKLNKSDTLMVDWQLKVLPCGQVTKGWLAGEFSRHFVHRSERFIALQAAIIAPAVSVCWQ